MQRARRSAHLPIPCSVEEFGKILEGEWSQLGMTKEKTPKAFYRALIQTNDSSSVLFASPELYDMLTEVDCVNMDTTFRVLPNELGTYKIFVIHFIELNSVS